MPEAAEWPEHILQANLRMGFLKDDGIALKSSGHRPPVAVSITSDAPSMTEAQKQSRASKPLWLVKEMDRRFVPQGGPVKTEPKPAGVTIAPGQGPSASSKLEPEPEPEVEEKPQVAEREFKKQKGGKR